MFQILSLVAGIGGFIFNTFSDPSFITSQTNFSAGQNVYLKVESASSGEKIKDFFLLDENKNKIFDINIAVSGRTPFVYTGVFSAPQNAGVYYIDVKLDDGAGITFSGQRNINVKGEGKPEVKAEIKSESTAENSSESKPIETNYYYSNQERDKSDINLYSRLIDWLRGFLLRLFSGSRKST